MKDFGFKKDFSIMRTGLFVLTFVFVVLGFKELLFKTAPLVFSLKQEDMSHGWYVPLFSLYVIWTERKAILESLSQPGWGGVVASLPLLFLALLGERGGQFRFSMVALAGLFVTIPWAFWGRKTAKKLFFPAAFLLFCVPLSSYLDVVTVHMRLLASSVAFGVLRGFGADVVLHGTSVISSNGNFAIDIADPCSGLRSLFALMALTAGYAYFTQKSWLKRGILFLLSAPIAIIGNVARIVTICLVANFADKDFALGFYHDYSGYVVFAVAIALMVAAGEFVSHLPLGKIKTPSTSSGSTLVGHLPLKVFHKVLMCGFSLMIASSMVFQIFTPEPVYAEAPNIEFPVIEGFSISELGPSESELEQLPEDTIILKRLYESIDGKVFLVSAVIGGKNRLSIHRPELCMPAQGYFMSDTRTINSGGIDWRTITLSRQYKDEATLSYTFFNQDGYRTARHSARILRDALSKTIYNRIDRWVMLTVNSAGVDDDRLVGFLEKLKGMVK